MFFSDTYVVKYAVYVTLWDEGFRNLHPASRILHSSLACLRMWDMGYKIVLLSFHIVFLVLLS